MRTTTSHRRGVGVLYVGLVVFAGLAAFTARSIWTAWQERSDHERAAAVFELVAERTLPRPTNAPGAMAWLLLELDRYGRREPDRARAARYASLAASGDRVPASLEPLLDVMLAAPMAEQGMVRGSDASPRLTATGAGHGSLREERTFEVDGQPVIVTRRKTRTEAERAPSDAFVRRVASPLVQAGAAIEGAIAGAEVPNEQRPRPVRLYAILEDGTLVSAPWADRAWPDTAAHELAVLSSRPRYPAFASVDFFFGFDPGAAAPQARYSGFYLDVAGRGVVSTILVPFTMNGWHAVLALDLAFEIDWPSVARSVAPPVIGAALDIKGSASWQAFDAALAADAPGPLHEALAALARTTPTSDDGTPLRHGVVEAGTAAAFQVSDRTWLLMLFPKASPEFPIAPVGLLVGMLAVLFAGFEFNRRRAEAERKKAERAFTEKQNLLDTMQVPLVVVDPNTDVVVSSNHAAASIGVRAGSRFADLVWPDARSREHYQRMQVATSMPRRAYGVPVAVRDDNGTTVRGYAVVRSVAVTAPIEALAADERHRLAVFFVLDRDADLALIGDEITSDAQREERRRLAGLLSHGVDSLARVLEHLLNSSDGSGETRAFAAWLSEYLERRLTVTAWLLDHWEAQPPLPSDIVIDSELARRTLDRMASVLDAARRDRVLRARLHWDNGTLAGGASGPVFDVAIDWPATCVVTCPVRGGFGLFVGELITNAVRHGRPATQPSVRLTCDRVRKELTLVVENDIDASQSAGRGGAYGGLAIVRAMARLFEWQEIACGPSDGHFVAQWLIPMSESGRNGDAD
jgi:hypothetical protein